MTSTLDRSIDARAGSARRMLTLEFSDLLSRAGEVVGPAPAFRVSGNFIRTYPVAQVVAEYIRHEWHVRGERFSRYHCHAPLQISFMDALDTRAPTLGPFQHVSATDGTMYADGELFAKFIEETLLWHSFRLQTHWPNLILEPV
jgi:hypothetical protein